MTSNFNPTFKSRTTSNSTSIRNRRLRQPPHIPRELMDNILTLVINSYDHDPAYQWNKLRSISRFHKAQIENQFLKHWLPKLTITAYQTKDISVTYRATGVNNGTKDGSMARFKAKDGWEELDTRSREGWTRHLWNEEKRLIIRLPLADEINNPYYEVPLRFSQDGGWRYTTVHDPGLQARIFSDCWIPSLAASKDGERIYFDWKALFSTIFREEMLMRYVTESFLRKFPRMHCETKHPKIWATVVRLLRTDVQLWRRVILSYYREHVTNHPNTPFEIIEDWLELEWGQDMAKMRRPPPSMREPLSILRFLLEEESMVFSMSGDGMDWRRFNEEEVKMLREEEKKWYWDLETGTLHKRLGNVVCGGG